MAMRPRTLAREGLLARVRRREAARSGRAATMLRGRRDVARSVAARRDEPRDGAQRRRGGDQRRSPARAVQLGGVADRLALVARRGRARARGRLRHARRRRRASGGVGSSTASRTSLAWRRGGHAAGVLLRVHALVGDPQGLVGVRRLGRERDRAVRAADPEAVAVLGERERGALDERASGPRRAARSSAQNSSPPMRKARPRSSRKAFRLAPRRASRTSPAGWPKVSL